MRHYPRIRAAASYGAMVGAAVALFLIVRRYGEMLPAPAAAPALAIAAPATEAGVFWHLLLALLAVVVAGRGLGRLFTALGQPPVIAEVLLGPSLLGAISPEAYRFILPPTVVPFLGVVAQIGVVLYMFQVGLDLNPALLRGQVHATVATSHASILLPFVLGAALAL